MNVEDFKDGRGRWVSCYRVNNRTQWTVSGRKWDAMQYRCKAGGLLQTKRPTYVGCTMSQEFANFQTFTDWHISQVGYGMQGYELDKDVLVPGNKLYSAETCVLVPSALNQFFSDNGKSSGYHKGVSLYKRSGRYTAQIRADGDQITLGYFHTPEEAAAVYVAAKEAEAKRWAARLSAGEFMADPKVIHILLNYTYRENT